LSFSQRRTRENDPARRNTISEAGFVKSRDDAGRCHRRRKLKRKRQRTIRSALGCTVVRQPVPDRISDRVIVEMSKADCRAKSNDQISAGGTDDS
jgi:hypothetical protein